MARSDLLDLGVIRNVGASFALTPFGEKVRLRASEVRMGVLIEISSMLGIPRHGRIAAAYIRLICNGWITRCRFQNTGSCAFGCGHDEHSMEHFAFCSKVRAWSEPHAGLAKAPRGHKLSHLLCMEADVSRCSEMFFNKEPSEGAILSRALCCYASFRTHNAVRNGELLEGECEHAFCRFLHEGIRGSPII